jgi:Fe-S-cluster containining protein
VVSAREASPFPLLEISSNTRQDASADHALRLDCLQGFYQVKSLADYRSLVAEVDRLCRRVGVKYASHMACRKGCAGNCCRIHLSVLPVEAASLARSLTDLPTETAGRLRARAVRTTTFGPCPLLEEGACRMYASRLVICRTHGFPMATEYRGRRAVGCCRENFQRLQPIPEDAVIDLDRINRALAEVNRAFVAELEPRRALRPRYFIAEALLLDL